MSEEVPKIVDKCVDMGLLEIQGTYVMLTDKYIDNVETVIKLVKLVPELKSKVDEMTSADDMIGLVTAISIIRCLGEIREEDLMEILPVMIPLTSRYLIFRSVR